MLAFTLTAFLELMDHGIVSWDMVSITFIKQVSLGGGHEWILFLFMLSCISQEEQKTLRSWVLSESTVTPFLSLSHSPQGLLGGQQLTCCLLWFQIAGYVSQPMVDVSILQRSLAILESMVLNSQSLYQKIAEEITVGQLISHLQVWVSTQQWCDWYQFYGYLFISKYILLHLERTKIIFLKVLSVWQLIWTSGFLMDLRKIHSMFWKHLGTGVLNKDI